MKSIYWILAVSTLIIYVAAQNTPPPPPCNSNDNKDECFQYRNDCAWCKNEEKCSNWDACKDTADDCDDPEIPESRSKDDQCTTNKGVMWIFIIVFGFIAICCLAGCVIILFKVCIND